MDTNWQRKQYFTLGIVEACLNVSRKFTNHQSIIATRTKQDSSILLKYKASENVMINLILSYLLRRMKGAKVQKTNNANQSLPKCALMSTNCYLTTKTMSAIYCMRWLQLSNFHVPSSTTMEVLWRFLRKRVYSVTEIVTTLLFNKFKYAENKHFVVI